MVQVLGDVQTHECDHQLSYYSGLHRQILPKKINKTLFSGAHTAENKR